MYVGVTRWLDASSPGTGMVFQTTPAGATTALASMNVGDGFLTGIALDASGRVYVGAVTHADDPAVGVYRVERGGSCS